MHKKNIYWIFTLLITISLSGLVSAQICKGSDGYWHDCDSYYGHDDNNYPYRNYDYYKQNKPGFRYDEDNYDTRYYEERDSYQEFDRSKEKPFNYPTYGSRYDENYPGKEFLDDFFTPSSSWRYKEHYNVHDYKYYDNYYYEPRYDSDLGHYNWRY